MSLSRWRYLAIATLVLLLVPAIAACGTTTTTGWSLSNRPELSRQQASVNGRSG